MTWVRRAVALGYRNPKAYRTEYALDPLRARDDFRLLMMDLTTPVEPFAPALSTNPVVASSAPSESLGRKDEGIILIPCAALGN